MKIGACILLLLLVLASCQIDWIGPISRNEALEGTYQSTEQDNPFETIIYWGPPPQGHKTVTLRRLGPTELEMNFTIKRKSSYTRTVTYDHKHGVFVLRWQGKKCGSYARQRTQVNGKRGTYNVLRVSFEDLGFYYVGYRQ